VSPPTKQRREALFDSAADAAPLIGVDVDGVSYLVDTTDQRVGRSLLVIGRRGEMGVLSRVTSILRETHGLDTSVSTFIDVGANIGTTTIPALTEQGFRDAVVCEPVAENFRLLHANLILNGLDRRTRMIPAAISDAIEKTEIRLHRQNSGAHQLVRGGQPGREGESRRLVPTTTLDALVQRGVIDLDRAGLLWMDTQGHEPKVLAGAGTVVAAGVPILLEYMPNLIEKRNERQQLFESVREGYSHFVDMRTSGAGALERLPIDLLSETAPDRWDPDGLTDLLLLRD
jgi:FkbM family methyltransferase